MKTRYLAILATLAFLGFSVPAAAHECSRHADQSHKHCPDDPEPAPSGGNKAFLFEIASIETCEPVIDTGGESFGNVTWAGNVLWDPKNIHVHYKLQLKDVDPEDNIPILGNNDGVDLGRSCGTGTVDFPLCADDNCTPSIITVKQNQQGRTSGALRLPGCDPDEPTTVWVTVTVNHGATILRSTPVTVVLPPNEVGTGPECS